MDGYKASQLIRAGEALRHSEAMPIVAITAGSVTKANDATAYQEAGMTELIHKPFSNAKLLALFNKRILLMRGRDGREGEMVKGKSKKREREGSKEEQK